MRIVHLTQSTVAEITGGLEYHVKYLTAALEQLGHEVFVVSPELVEKSVRFRPSGSVDVSFLPAPVRHRWDALVETALMLWGRVSHLRHAARVAQSVENLRPDLVHQHSYVGELRTCRMLAMKYPVVFTNHTGAYLHLDRWLPTRYLQRRLMKRFTMAIGPSRELTPQTDNSHYVPNGVDTKLFSPASRQGRELIRARYRLAGKRVFLCPRRWAPTKGIFYLAQAMRGLPQIIRAGSVFVFAGNETPGYARYQGNVRRALAASGCEVRVLGNLSPHDLAEFMNVAEACVCPSLLEATSLACLESMACATPVIGTRVGGLPELIRHGENGWLVPARDVKALAAAIEYVYQLQPADLEQTGQKALATVKDTYTWELAARRTEIVYQKALEKWKSGEPAKSGIFARKKGVPGPDKAHA